MSTLLVVDDDADIREAIGLVLEETTHQVLMAENGRQALATLRSAGTLPCLILLDLTMPVMNGWEFLAAQQEDPKLADVPVVLMTALGDGSAKPTNVAAHLSKPIGYDDLLAMVQRFAA